MTIHLQLCHELVPQTQTPADMYSPSSTFAIKIITLATSIVVRVMHRSGIRLSVRPSVPNLTFLTLVERAAHTQRHSPEDSTQRGQRVFPPKYYKDWHICYGWINVQTVHFI